jgi:hypothetical protein
MSSDVALAESRIGNHVSLNAADRRSWVFPCSSRGVSASDNNRVVIMSTERCLHSIMAAQIEKIWRPVNPEFEHKLDPEY